MFEKILQVYLASTSVRRCDLLKQIGIGFQTLHISVLEEIRKNELPEEFAKRIALEKALVGWTSSLRTIDLPVIAGDTIIALEKKILVKPKHRDEAISMLQRLSGKTHSVLSAVAVVKGDKIETSCSNTYVTFREISLSECEAYWETGEPPDKSGGYAIQGVGAVFVEKIEGSYSGVVGLPISETAELLKKFDIRVL